MKNWFSSLSSSRRLIIFVSMGLIALAIGLITKLCMAPNPPQQPPLPLAKSHLLRIEKDENGFDVIVPDTGEPIATFQAQALIAEISSTQGSHIKAYRVASCNNCDARFELLVWNSMDGTTFRTPYPGEHTLIRTESDDEVLEKQVVGGYGRCGGQSERILIWQQTRLVDMLEGELKPSSEWERTLWVVGFDDRGAISMSQDQHLAKEVITQYFESECQMIPPEDTSDYL